MLARLRRQLATLGVALETCHLDEPFEQPLRNYLAARNRRP